MLGQTSPAQAAVLRGDQEHDVPQSVMRVELLTVHMLHKHTHTESNECFYYNSVSRCAQVCAGVSDLGEAQVQDVGVEFAQCSGEPVAAQVLTAELTEGETAL